MRVANYVRLRNSCRYYFDLLWFGVEKRISVVIPLEAVISEKLSAPVYTV